MNKFPAQLTLILLVLSLIAPSFVFAQRPGVVDGRPAPRRPRPSSDPKLAAIQRDFDEALKLVQEQYVDGKKLSYNDVFKSSIIGMLRSLDPHSNYYDREEFEELKTDQRSEYFGIGASIQNYLYKDQADTYITATFDGSPASKAGLRYGDRIVEVDGVAMTGKTSLEVRDKIRGPRGSTVKLTLERAADKRLEKVEIVRDAVPQPSIPDAYMLRPGVGYIDMTRGFNYTTTDELVDAIDRLEAKGMKSLVLDLRNNPGGFLDQAIHVAEVFLPSGQLILTQKGRNGYRDNSFESKNNSPNTTPLVILINEQTASASEIVAGAMQDHDRALIVGQTSFGKGLVQSIIPLDYGAGLTLTSAKYFTPSGRLIQRDYSNGGFYDYYTHGAGVGRDPKRAPALPSGPEKKTDTGRAVYGGGGIMPDYFVPLDTTLNSHYLNELYTSTSIQEYTFGYAETHKDELLKKGFQSFLKSFVVTDDMLASLVKVGERNKVKPDQKELRLKKKLFQVHIKAQIARKLWSNEGFFQVMNETNEILLQAMKLFDRIPAELDRRKM